MWLYELFFSFFSMYKYLHIAFHVCVMWTGKIFSSTKKKTFFFSFCHCRFHAHNSFLFLLLLPSFFSRKWCICICGCCNCCCRLLQSYFILFFSSYCIHYILAVLAYLFTLGFWCTLFTIMWKLKTLSLSIHVRDGRVGEASHENALNFPNSMRFCVQKLRKNLFFLRKKKEKNTAQFTFAAVHKHNRNVRKKKQLHRERRKKNMKKKYQKIYAQSYFWWIYIIAYVV